MTSSSKTNSQKHESRTSKKPQEPNESFGLDNNKNDEQQSNVPTVHAALAEAELFTDEDNLTTTITNGLDLNDVEYVDNESNDNQMGLLKAINRQSCPLSPNSLSKLTGAQPPSPFKTEKCNEQIAKKINNLKMNYLSSQSTNLATTVTKSSNLNCESRILSPEERLSNEAREYWATIDLYNNSKMAFNKRCKSVKQKRDKLNAELQKRHQDQIQQQQRLSIEVNNIETTMVLSEEPFSPSKTNDQSQAQHNQQELCTCVKCSIVYHEALIKGITDIQAIVCKKCKNKLINCKCCSSYMSTNGNGNGCLSPTPSSNSTGNNRFSMSSLSTEQNVRQSIKDEFVQFEDKLFNIKNELVS